MDIRCQKTKNKIKNGKVKGIALSKDISKNKI